MPKTLFVNRVGGNVYIMIFWHIQMNQPHGRGETTIDSKKMLEQQVPVIGTGNWEDFQCDYFKGIGENALSINDIILIHEGQKVIALCKIISECFEDSTLKSEFYHHFYRKVEVLDWYNGNEKYPQPQGTLQRLIDKSTVSYQFIENWYNKINPAKNMQKYTKLLQSNKNLILTGAPGTGKTYLAKKMAEAISQTNAMDKESAIRSIIDTKLKKDGVYKTKSGVAEFVITKIVNNTFMCQPKSSTRPYDVKKEDIVDCIMSGKINEPVKIYDDLGIFEGTYIVGLANFVFENLEKIESKSHTAFVQFHSSYDYTDFVEGLRPVQRGETLGFELKNGIFKDFCKKAKDNPNNNHVFIIDEINRGEISKIFGELFFALDAGYRGEKGKVKTQYSNIQTEATAFIDANDDYFYVPDNVYIIGTMNDIDRSVESFDFAMRRRFAWHEIKAIDRIDMWENATWKDEAKNRMIALNQAIETKAKLSSAYHVGPAYFLKLDNYDGDFSQLWQYHIEVLLKEYLRGLPNETEILKELEKAYNLNENNG